MSNPKNNPDDSRERLAAQQAFDQSLAAVAESFPPMWRRMYENCVEEGFTKREAMDLVKTYITSLNTTK